MDVAGEQLQVRSPLGLLVGTAFRNECTSPWRQAPSPDLPLFISAGAGAPGCRPVTGLQPRDRARDARRATERAAGDSGTASVIPAGRSRRLNPAAASQTLAGPFSSAVTPSAEDIGSRFPSSIAPGRDGAPTPAAPAPAHRPHRSGARSGRPPPRERLRLRLLHGSPGVNIAAHDPAPDRDLVTGSRYSLPSFALLRALIERHLLSAGARPYS